MFFNIFILGSAGFVFSWDRAMYSILAYFVAYKTMDIVIAGLDESKFVWIISDESQEIGDAILNRLVVVLLTFLVKAPIPVKIKKSSFVSSTV